MSRELVFISWEQSLDDGQIVTSRSLRGERSDPITCVLFTPFILAVSGWRSSYICCTCRPLPGEELIPVDLTRFTILAFIVRLIIAIIFLEIKSGLLSHCLSTVIFWDTASSELDNDLSRIGPLYDKCYFSLFWLLTTRLTRQNFEWDSLFSRRHSDRGVPAYLYPYRNICIVICKRRPG